MVDGKRITDVSPEMFYGSVRVWIDGKECRIPARELARILRTHTYRAEQKRKFTHLFMADSEEEYSVSSVWCESDVETLEEYSDMEFTPEERRDILDTFKNREDASIGLNWEQLEAICKECWTKKCS